MPFRKIYNVSATAIGYALRLSIFFGILFGFYVIYKLLLEQTLDGSYQILPAFLLWILTAYIVIPRIHRILSKYYLPNYFVGRIRSPSGFLSDPINLALFGREKDIHEAFQKSGWQLADKLSPLTFLKAAFCTIFRRSYPSAPVGDMFLFNRRHDFAYEQEINGSPNQRHHIRVWKTPKNWFLPGGYKAEWLVAATHDTHVGIKLATGQLDHFIHEDVDNERDYVIKTLKKSGHLKQVETVSHFTDSYHDRNNGGDRIRTDGSLPFIYL